MLGRGDDARLRALEQLYRARYPYFLRIATAIVGDEDRARDAVQDGFAAAMRNRRAFRGEGALDGWVWRIVVNAARQNARAATLVDSDALAFVSAANGDVDDEFGVRRWIAALPERQRLAVFLRYFADLDYRTIAVALDVEIGTVSATLNTAHSNLRQMLSEVSS
jgi:RNA polymerase sigma-70 factor, ECF subfamily